MLALLILAAGFFQPLRALDLSGTYDSEISGARYKKVYSKSRNPEVKIEHDGHRIKGRLGDEGGSFGGSIDGDKITIRWRNGRGTNGGSGVWYVLQTATGSRDPWNPAITASGNGF